MERERMVGHSNIITKEAFVAPTPSSNHSMLHQTFTHPLLSSLLPPRPPQVKNAMEPSPPPEKNSQDEPQFVLPNEVPWPWSITEQVGSVLNEHFSVDDLLDFDGLENEDEDDTHCAAAAAAAAVTFEAPPPPPPPSDINLPTHDAEEFEWMSSIIDDSIPTYPPCTAAVPRFTPAPPPAAPVVKAKRSKRSRRRDWPGNPSFSDSSSSSTTTFSSSVSSSSSHPSHFMLKYADYELEDIFHEPKKRGRKLKPHRPAPPGAAPAARDKCCTHCGSQQTPQWRAGPEGPKTLCNACGVRYKSGRLVPEYRPTASPTFVPEVHSASHRKVLLMRQRKEEQHRLAAVSGAPPVASF